MNIHNSWKSLFHQYKFDIDEIYADKHDIMYPPKDQVFRVFEMDVNDIRIVLLGQDPYHAPTQAHGLSFSVPSGVKIPPSLRNIYKELHLEFPERQYEFNSSGNLEAWFHREKIFLLNASLSVIHGKPGSCMKMWENFTNDVIRFISEQNNQCVFLLLGNFAKKKASFIACKERIVMEAHPSPLARGFVGSNVFKRVEAIMGGSVNWEI